MPSPGISYRLVPGVRQSARRGIGFLEGHSELNAGPEFDALTVKTRNDLLTFMQEWVNGQRIPDTRFHEFKSKPRYRDCVVFKPRGGKRESKQDRYYGYICHPSSERRFQACVLCISAEKDQMATDDAELERVIQWQATSAAVAAVNMRYPKPGGPTQ